MKLIITCNLPDAIWGLSDTLKDWAEQGLTKESDPGEFHKGLCEIVNEDLQAAMEDSEWDFEED